MTEETVQTNLFELPARKLTLKKHEPASLMHEHTYAVCLVNVKALGVKTFSYIIPPEMSDKIKIGQAYLSLLAGRGLLMRFV